MIVVHTVQALGDALASRRPRGVLGFVPTMGALHAGHLALLQAARSECATVVASVFVNPAQFDDAADLAAYRRDEARDEALARDAGVDVLFAPSVDEMYPDGFATWVDVEGAALGLEADLRPGHFRGVATICLKLFSLIRPRLAFFGQKDAQQVAVVRQMVRDFNLDLEIRVIPTVRDRDGLALSSRNARLSPEERARARAIPRALVAGLDAYRRGQDPVAAAQARLDDITVDYVAAVDFTGQLTLTVGARVGSTHLIDNVPLVSGAPGSGRELEQPEHE